MNCKDARGDARTCLALFTRASVPRFGSCSSSQFCCGQTSAPGRDFPFTYISYAHFSTLLLLCSRPCSRSRSRTYEKSRHRTKPSTPNTVLQMHDAAAPICRLVLQQWVKVNHGAESAGPKGAAAPKREVPRLLSSERNPTEGAIK